MKTKDITGAFVLQNKTDKTFFGVKGWSVVPAPTQDHFTTVIFRRNKIGKRTVCQTGWHQELWDRLTKKDSIYSPIQIK